MSKLLKLLQTTVLMILLIGILVPSVAIAEQRDFKVVFKIPEVTKAQLAAHPGVSFDTLVVKKSQAIASKLAKSLEKRMTAASVKDFRVNVNNFDVKVSMGGSDAQDPGLLGLLTLSGYVEIRPLLSDQFQEANPDWDKLSGVLPQGVAIMGQGESSYLWSANAMSLPPILRQVSMTSAKTVSRNGKPARYRLISGPVANGKDAGVVRLGENVVSSSGYRSYVLGDVIATHQDLLESRWKFDASSGASVTLTFAKPVAYPKQEAQALAVMIDDALVAMIPASRSYRQVVLYPPPSMSKADQKQWARKMAGQFAAQISIPFGVVDEATNKTLSPTPLTE